MGSSFDEVADGLDSVDFPSLELDLTSEAGVLMFADACGVLRRFEAGERPVCVGTLVIGVDVSCFGID